MSKCRYDLSKDCNNTDCLNCVLDKIEEEINSPNRGTCDYFIVDRIEEIIKKYKAESKPKTGHWIKGECNCPVCGEDKYKDLDADVWSDWQPKFCPNCGAKMESEEP